MLTPGIKAAGVQRGRGERGRWGTGVGQNLSFSVLPTLLCFAATVIGCATAIAADKSGVTPNTISLPSGPGSIEGLGEAFQPTLNTGTAKYGVGLRLPPGTAGHAPSLLLRYEGGSGNGPLGFGWNLPLPYIQRQCDKGIPRYVDENNQLDDDRDGDVDEYDERDVFINEMKEELVPQVSGYLFCENEGAFIRYRRNGDHWEGTLPSGTRLEFGLTAAGRVEDAATGRVFRWLLERTSDTHGNTIVYSYRSFPDNSDRNQKYLAAVRYGPGAPPWQNFHFAVFAYENRPDWFEDCRSGFIVRTGKRLKEIIVGTQGQALAGHLAGDFDGDGNADHLVRKYQLDYLRYAGTNSHWSLLAKVLQVGADGTSSLPPATFGYAVCDPPALLSASGREIGGLNEPPFVMDNELADLADLNGDGLPDILKTDSGGGAHIGYLNQGEVTTNGDRAIQWSTAREVASADGLAWNVDLASANDVAHLADMDGDGVADLTYKSVAGDVFYFANEAKLSWKRRQAMSIQDSAPPAPFGDPEVRTADLDFDKRIDIVQSISVGDGAEYRIWFNLGQQRYARSLTVPQTSGFLFSQAGVHLVDFNGDRVPDIVRLRSANVTVTAGLGYGQFTEPIIVAIPDPGLEDAQIATAKLQDITGDGLTDLVLERAEPGQLWYWLNLGNYTFAPRKIISGMPTGLGLQPAIRWADLNGNGTTDLIYADSQSLPRLLAVDIGELLGCVPGHNVITNIANGIGRVTTIEYQPSTRFALDDAAAGHPWPDMMPFSVSVVSTVITDDSLGHQYVTRYRYHNGYYDAEEKEFRGFAQADQIQIGDATAPTLVTRSWFDTGREHEALKGKLLRQNAGQEDGKLFWDEMTRWTTPPKTLKTGVNGQPVHYAHPTSTARRVIEVGQGEERLLESEMGYDDFGNAILHANYGIVVAGDRSAFDDERITTTEYALNTSSWLIRFPSRSEIKDEHGTIISRVETFYDDPSWSGANFGQVSTGDPTLTRDWIDPTDPNAFVNSTRILYSEHGNPVRSFDPLAVASVGAPDPTKGHWREVRFDSRFHAFPEEEIIYLGDGKSPLVVQAVYDQGFGTVVRSVDFNGHETSYGYDEFGRLIRMIRPGDTPDFPTTEYSYVMAVPTATGGVVNFVETRFLDKPPGTFSNFRDHYCIGRQFTDGFGRRILTKTEAEPLPGETQARVVVSGAFLFNARLQPAISLNPFFCAGGGSLDALLAYEDIAQPGWSGVFHVDGDLQALDLATAHQTRSVYDALLRTSETINPDGTRNRVSREPLVARTFDENDADPTSPHFDTPMAYHRDGLDRKTRTDEIVRLNDDGTSSSELKTWTTSYQYDLNGQLIGITDSQNNVQTMRYDGLGRLTHSHDVDRGTMTYRYDAASNLIESRDAKNQRIVHTYDGANRLLTEDYLDEDQTFSFRHIYDPFRPITATNRPDVAYFYDLSAGELDQGDASIATARNTRGMLAFVWDLSGEEHTSYDSRGRVEWAVKRVRDPVHQQLVSYRTGTGYDSADRLVRVTYPDNDEVRYQYNARSLLERVTGGPTGFIISNLEYLPTELKRNIHYGNGVKTTYRYDPRLRLNSILTLGAPDSIGGTSAELLHFRYFFDPVSNLLRIEDQRPGALVPNADPRRNTQLFAYDNRYRLTRVQYSFNEPGQPIRDDGEIQYRYDRIGNMLSQFSTIEHFENGLSLTDLGQMDSGGAPGRWNRQGRSLGDPPGPHALTAITPRGPPLATRNYSYDPNGNMTNADGLDCQWDFNDRLVRAETDKMLLECVYDHAGHRVIKKVTPKTAGKPSTVLYIARHFEIREYEEPTKFVWTGYTRVARVVGSLSANERVQRLRVHPGWNLISLAVESAETLVQLQTSASRLGVQILEIHRWSPENQDYEDVNVDDNLPAGTVLWLKASQAGTLALKGTYPNPSGQPVMAGGGYSAGAGLEALNLDSALLEEAGIWTFDAAGQQWHARFTGELNQSLAPPKFIAPGEAVFIDAKTPDVRQPPDERLRVRYYHQDHLGSSAHVTDAQGQRIEEGAFYPFGGRRVRRTTTDLSNSYDFAQKEKDAETGLHNFEARYLASQMGRFIVCDPLGLSAASSRLDDPQRFHPYSYAANNPLTRVDPLGLEDSWLPSWDDVADVATATGGYFADKAEAAVNYVSENPGTTAAVAVGSVVLFPITVTASAVGTIYGTFDTSKQATEDAVEAATGDDFEADGGYDALNADERKEKTGKAIGGYLEVGISIAGSKTPASPKAAAVPKVPNTSSAALANTQKVPTMALADTQKAGLGQFAKTVPESPAAIAAERSTRLAEGVRHTHRNNYIIRTMRDRERYINALREAGKRDEASDAIEQIFNDADRLYGPGAWVE